MSLDKSLEDLSLSDIQTVSKTQITGIITSCRSENIDLPSILNLLSSRIYSCSFSIKKLLIGHKISSSSLIFIYKSSICILDLLGHYLEIKLPSMSLSSFKVPSQEPRQHFSFNKSNEKVFIFGGLNEKLTFLSNLLIFDINLKDWINLDLENPPLARSLHCSWAINDYLFIYSGFSEKGWLRNLVVIELNSLNTQSLRLKGFIPRPHSSCACVALNNDFFVFSVFHHLNLVQNQLFMLEVRNLEAKVFELTSPDFVVDKVISGHVCGNLIIFVTVLAECFSIVCYDSVLRSWKRAWMVEDVTSEVRADKIEIIPVIMGNEVYMVKFYNNFYIKNE